MAKKISREQRFLDEARKLRRRNVSSRDYWNKLCGVDGLFGQLFPTQSERIAFSRSDPWKEFQRLWHELQERDKRTDPAFAKATENANGTVILRLPKSVHAALIREADQEGTSLNQLCLAKLSAQLAAVVS